MVLKVAVADGEALSESWRRPSGFWSKALPSSAGHYPALVKQLRLLRGLSDD